MKRLKPLFWAATTQLRARHGGPEAVPTQERQRHWRDAKNDGLVPWITGRQEEAVMLQGNGERRRESRSLAEAASHVDGRGGRSVQGRFGQSSPTVCVLSQEN